MYCQILFAQQASAYGSIGMREFLNLLPEVCWCNEILCGSLPALVYKSPLMCLYCVYNEKIRKLKK